MQSAIITAMYAKEHVTHNIMYVYTSSQMSTTVNQVTVYVCITMPHFGWGWSEDTVSPQRLLTLEFSVFGRAEQMDRDKQFSDLNLHMQVC